MIKLPREAARLGDVIYERDIRAYVELDHQGGVGPSAGMPQSGTAREKVRSTVRVGPPNSTKLDGRQYRAADGYLLGLAAPHGTSPGIGIV